MTTVPSNKRQGKAMGAGQAETGLPPHLEDAAWKLSLHEAREKIIADVRAVLDAEVQRHLKDVAFAVEKEQETALRHVGDVAVDKTLRIVTETRQWLFGFVGLLIAAAGVLGFFGWQSWSQLTANAMKRVDDKIESWLAIGSDSPIKTSLERLRTRTILDSYLVRALRTREEDGFDRPAVTLSDDDRARLYLILKDPATPLTDYADAARLVHLSKGPEAMWWADPDTAKVVKAVFESGPFSDEQRYQLLISWSGDKAMAPVARALLEKRGMDKGWVSAAFRIIQRTEPDEARDYALRELPLTKDDRLAEDMAAFLVGRSVGGTVVNNWLKDIETRRVQGYQVIIANLAANAVAALPQDSAPTADVAAAAAQLVHALDLGAGLVIHRDRFAGNDVFLSYSSGGTTYLRQMSNLEKFFKRSDVVTLVLRGSLQAGWERFARHLQQLAVRHQGQDIAALRVDVSGGGALRMSNGQIVDVGVTHEPVLLHPVVLQGRTGIRAHWQTRNGTYLEGDLVELREPAAVQFHYAYDQDVIGRLEMRRVSQFFRE
ncbi:MAG: hypothetical protein QM742_09260 [Aquabacterium sp.]